MWVFAMAALAFGSTEDCEVVNLGDILAVPPPAVIVLGERHGSQPDLRRASRVVHSLLRRAPVTVALEAVNADDQPVLEDYAVGRFSHLDLPEQLDWDNSWGFPFKPYESLLTSIRQGTKVVGVGVELGPAPVGSSYPVPTGYTAILRDATHGHDTPLEMESRLVRSMAWADYSIASAAVEGWGGDGYLVIVAGRDHVEGGKGVGWQSRLLVPRAVSVESFVLAWGVEPPCYDGDRYWK